MASFFYKEMISGGTFQTLFKFTHVLSALCSKLRKVCDDIITSKNHT